MSADVVLATHADGVLRCYRRAADGALSQTAQIVANAQLEPTALAQLAGDLSDLFDWHGVSSAENLNGSRPIKATAAPALEHNGDANSELLDVIREHPNETSSSIGTLLLGDKATPTRRDAVRKRLERLVQLGEIVRHRPNPAAHYRYRIAGTGPSRSANTADDYRKRPRASHAEREQRRVAVLAYLHEHPDSTAREIAAAVFGGDNPDLIGKARSILEQLGVAQLVRRTEHGDSPLTFALIEPEPEHPNPGALIGAVDP